MHFPDRLWHYTDAAGLYGMVNSGLLRFGDVRFLNDKTERTHGLGVVLKTLDAAVAKDGPDSAVAITRSYMDDAFSQHKHYAASLSERNESLSQWQRYGADGYGYCVAFDMTQLDLDSQRVAFRIDRMIYRPSEQVQSVENFINAAVRPAQIEADRGPSADRAAFLEECGAVSSLGLEYIALQLKNPIFEDELEWRLLRLVRMSPVHSSSAPELQFAQRGNYVKAFIDEPLPMRVATKLPRLPLAAVVTGPRLDADLAIATVKELLLAKGYAAAAESVFPSTLRDTWR